MGIQQVLMLKEKAVNFTKVGSRIRNNFTMAKKMIRKSPVLSEMDLDIHQFYAERKDRSIEGTYEFDIDINESVAQNFLDWLLGTYDFRYTDKFYRPSLQELIDRKTVDGKRLARLWRSQGLDQFHIDRYSALNFTDDESKIYLTVTSAPHMVMGVSAFGSGWGGYNGTSCLDFRFREPNQKHLLGLLSSDRVYVAFLHEGKDDFRNIKDPTKHSKAIGRATLIMDDEGNLHANSKMYFNNNTTRDILRGVLSEFCGKDIVDKEIVGQIYDYYDDLDDYLAWEDVMDDRGIDYIKMDSNMTPVACKTDFEVSLSLKAKVPKNSVTAIQNGDGEFAGYLINEKDFLDNIDCSIGDNILDSAWIFKINKENESIKELLKNPLNTIKVNQVRTGDYGDYKYTSVYDFDASECNFDEPKIFISERSLMTAYESSNDHIKFEYHGFIDVDCEIEQQAEIYSEGSFLSIDGFFYVMV